MRCPKCGDERAEAFSPRFHTCPTCDAVPALALEPGHHTVVLADLEVGPAKVTAQFVPLRANHEDRCPRRYWWSFNGVEVSFPSEPSEAMRLGREVHEESERLVVAVAPTGIAVTADRLCAMLQKRTTRDTHTGREIPVGGPIPRIVCADGFSMSVQADCVAYCTPRQNRGPWTHVEVALLSEPEEALAPYVDNDAGVYGYIPIELVVEIINRHGGLDPLRADLNWELKY